MKNRKINLLFIWILCIPISLIFLLAASGKFSQNGNMYENFLRWGYSYPLLVTVGIMEGVGGTLLVIPKVRAIGIFLLSMVMLGAGYTHLSHFEELGLPALPATLVFLLLAILFLDRKRDKI